MKHTTRTGLETAIWIKKMWQICENWRSNFIDDFPTKVLDSGSKISFKRQIAFVGLSKIIIENPREESYRIIVL
jgi:hypothetical protein